MHDLFQTIKVLLITLLVISGCTVSNPVPSTPQALKIGSKPIQLDPRKVHELSIAKFDPTQGSQWFAHLNQDHELWKITSPPADRIILDNLADGIFIMHLLDTFKSIQIKDDAPKGSLESLGLDPPLFSIRWRSGPQDSEIRVGLPLKDGSGTYFSFKGGSPMIATGSTFKMLSFIDSFDFLRRKTWATITADDVDEIQLRVQSRDSLYAQREGTQWTNEKHLPLKKDILKLLNHVTTAQAIEFIDDSVRAESLTKLIQSHPQYEIRLNGRSGELVTLRMIKKNGRLYGLNSLRPETVCVLDGSLLQSIDSKKK